MIEHVWKWDIVDNDTWFRCENCDEPIGALEIEARLNEHEALKRELVDVLNVSIARGEQLDYDDRDYEERVEALLGEAHRSLR